MRMPRVRFTVRRMMVPVAVVALALGMCIWDHRMRRVSVAYELRGLSYRKRSGPRPRFPALIPPPLSARERWDAEMAEKYRRAARYPWLPVAPDPPYPK